MERVHLRQLCKDDRDLFGLAYREEPGNENASEKLIDIIFETCLSHPEDEMAILFGDNNEWCGYCSVFYRESSIPEFGILLLPEYQGRGIGPEAIRQLIAYVRKNHNANEFVLKTTKTNTRCQRMCEKLGARLKGEVPHPLDLAFKRMKEQLGTESFQKIVGEKPPEFDPVLRYVIEIKE